MFFLPDSAPWWAVLGIAILFIVVTGVGVVLRAVWPQRSSDRKELLMQRQCAREQERKRRERRQRREVENRE